MKNELPSKYKKSFFITIRGFFAKVFNKNLQNQQLKKDTVIDKKVKVTNKYETDYLTQMRVESKKANIKKSILTMIDDNPKMIENLSVIRLKQLISMYDKEIEEKERKIELLKSKLSKGDK